jgi:hypothetical protein
LATPSLTLTLLPDDFAVCRLAPDASVPAWALRGSVGSVTRTPDEVSVVCAQADVPPGVHHEPSWRCFRAHGPFAFELTGILAALTAPLAAARVPLFALSTFDTDYLLVKAADLDRAIGALEAAGHDIHR